MDSLRTCISILSCPDLAPAIPLSFQGRKAWHQPPELESGWTVPGHDSHCIPITCTFLQGYQYRQQD